MLSRILVSVVVCTGVCTVATFSVSPAIADHYHPEELLVVGQYDRRQIDVADTVHITPDSAALVRRAPGANINGNGPLTGIPQYRGMYGSRVNVEVNGMTLSSGGPNWMDPPLSYAPTAQLESLQVYRGIAPVSSGQETIGGAINVTTWSGEFGNDTNFESSGRIRLGSQTSNSASLLGATVISANNNHRLKFSSLREQANNTDFNGGTIESTEYRRDRHDVGYGYQIGKHSLQIDAGRNETGDSGTPALPMDIEFIDSDLASIKYHFDGSQWSLSSKLYYSDIKHGMSNYHLRQAPSISSMWRRNIALGKNIGFRIDGKLNDNHGNWQFGIDGHKENHISDIDNPKSPMFFVVNFNDATRKVLGLFAERNIKIFSNWHGEFGLRHNQIMMDAGKVDGTPALMSGMMGMPSPGQTLRDQFNNSDRSQIESNTDWIAKLYYRKDEILSYYIGIAQKMRAPSYQERYLWLPLQATAGLADGRTYTGNINLNSETAHELELGLDLRNVRLELSPRVFYRHVDDYIQGTPSSNISASMFVAMMNNMNGTTNTPPLEFNNVDAKFYGFDMDWSYQLNNNWSLRGVVNYVRANRDDISDNLYRIAPTNTLAGLRYQSTNWSMTTEAVLYAQQNKVSKTNSEQVTAGYGLVNLKGYWQLNNELRLGFGIDNVLNKKYRDHQTGYNRARNSDIKIGHRLPGQERNVFIRLDYQW
ncbi:TonB-dependent receptor [Halieaceae bacterium]|nr:TonB-dependent receptor [Halieaceae bacterium]